LYSRLLQVKEALEAREGQKIPMCRVVLLFSDLICQGLGIVPRRPVSFKAYEEMVSRDVLYKARYTLTRLMDASDPRVAWSFIEIGLRAWFIAIHRFLNAQPRVDAGTYVLEFLDRLGITNRFMFAWGIRNLLNDVEAVEVVRKEGRSWYAMDILYIKLQYAKECRGSHGIRVPSQVSTTMHLPAILVTLWKYKQCLDSLPSGSTAQGLS
jgi:hypothetical protein